MAAPAMSRRIEVETAGEPLTGRLHGPRPDVRCVEAANREVDGSGRLFPATGPSSVRAVPGACLAKDIWQASLNRWCLSANGSMMGCVVADANLGAGRREARP